jgi:hypothetical protein
MTHLRTQDYVTNSSYLQFYQAARDILEQEAPSLGSSFLEQFNVNESDSAKVTEAGLIVNRLTHPSRDP